MRQEIEAFLDHVARENRFSDNTVAAYRNDLMQLADFLREKGAKTWGEVDRHVVLSYLIDLKGRGYALATVARKTASAKSLFKYLVSTGVMKESPTQNLGSPRVKKTLPHPLPEAQVRELLKQPDKYPTPEARRDKAMLEFLYATGVQVRELMLLNVDDVKLHEDSVSYSVRGSKERNDTVGRDAVPSLQRYMEEARPQLVHRDNERALFLNRLGVRLTRQGFWQILKGYAKEAKLDSLVTLRSLRHSLVTNSPNAKA